jgi:hypothetical protein
MDTERSKKGTFLPGNKGKPKGATNKLTREIKERAEWMLELCDERIVESIAKLRPKELVDLSVSLQEFIRPKLQRVNLDLGTEEKEIRSITFKVVRSSASTDTASNNEKVNTE